jgi:esterase/lipase
MISMPGIPTNQAHYWKTSAKLWWTSALEGRYCHGIVPTLLIAQLDLGKGPFSIAMAMGISIVMVVALATNLSTSSG